MNSINIILEKAINRLYPNSSNPMLHASSEIKDTIQEAIEEGRTIGRQEVERERMVNQDLINSKRIKQILENCICGHNHINWVETDEDGNVNPHYERLVSCSSCDCESFKRSLSR